MSDFVMYRLLQVVEQKENFFFPNPSLLDYYLIGVTNLKKGIVLDS